MQPPAWRRQGAEPDYRFSLANERTFLAWIRTALAFLAGGVPSAVADLAPSHRATFLTAPRATATSAVALASLLA